MERYNYKCALTGEAFDDIHHLYAKNLIIQATLDKLELPNTFDINACSTEEQQAFLNAFWVEQAKYPDGVCLSHKMHMLFHNKYGYGDNTPEQFYEFVKQVAPDKLDKILA